ncbi:MAG TPA: CPBP family glutamic-type intramembrane protease [Acidimicrobiales bacterium]|nr:CPBP family glutamic-type intramembrane protease [Acidimicrobiales bacterium]
MDAAPVGWYPDPYARFPYRWWDGSAWSPYARAGEVQWDPIDDAPKAERQPGLPAVGVALISFAIGAGASYLVLELLRSNGDPGGPLAELVLSEIPLWAALVGACFYVSFRRGTRSFVSDFGLRWRPLDIGLGLAGSIAGRSTESVAILPVVIFHPHFRAPDERVFHRFTISPTGWLVLALVVCVGAPIVEELFFRGMLQTRLVGRYGAVAGVAITSVLFGAAHLIGWSGPVTLVYGLAIAGGGVALGTIRQITGRLGTSMVAHSLFNAQALLALALVNSHGIKIG